MSASATINLFSDKVIQNTLTYWPKFKSSFAAKPTTNYEYSCYLVDTWKNSHLPQKAKNYFNFLAENDLQENLEKNCLGIVSGSITHCLFLRWKKKSRHCNCKKNWNHFFWFVWLDHVWWSVCVCDDMFDKKKCRHKFYFCPTSVSRIRPVCSLRYHHDTVVPSMPARTSDEYVR